MKAVKDIIAAASSLSAAERLQLVEAIWDSLLESPDTIRSPIKSLFDELDKHVPVVCTLTELMELRHDH
jgi:hypothetical protein